MKLFYGKSEGFAEFKFAIVRAKDKTAASKALKSEGFIESEISELVTEGPEEIIDSQSFNWESSYGEDI